MQHAFLSLLEIGNERGIGIFSKPSGRLRVPAENAAYNNPRPFPDGDYDY